MRTPIRKALTFRASSIGDCLMGKYLLENVHAAFPDARLGIVVASRGAMIRDLFRAYSWLEVLEVNRRNPVALWQLWKDFHGSDVIVTQYAGKKGGKFSFASKLVARLLTKKGALVGFSDVSRFNQFLYDKIIQFRSDADVADNDREALKALEIPLVFPFPTMRCNGDDAVAKFKLEAGNYIVVHLFAGTKNRGLSPEKKRELIQALSARFANTRLVISGGSSDREEAVRVSLNTNALVIAGEATLQEMMNLIKSSAGVVSVDTGMAHITAQLGKPLVIISTCAFVGARWWLPGQYGDTAPIAVLSRGDLCVAGHVYKEYPDCMNKIDMNEVVACAAVVLAP